MGVNIILAIAFLGAITIGIVSCRKLLKKSMDEDQPEPEQEG